MALSFRNSPRGVVGLDLDGSFMAAVQTSGDEVSRAVSTDLSAGLLTDGEVADVEGLSRAIRAFFKQNRLPRRVQLGVSNQQIVVRHLELPPIADEDERDAAVRFQAAEAIAMPLDEAELDYHVMGEGSPPGGSTQTRVLVVAARSTMVARLLEAVRGAGLKPEGIDLSAFALVRAMASPDALPEDARVYCHLGGVTNLAVALGSTCLFTRQLSTAWDEGGEDLAGALAEEIQLSIDFYMAQPEARRVGEIVLSGPGSNQQEGLGEELGERMGLLISGAPPLGRLDATGVPPEEDPHRHTVAAGLALGAST